MEYRLEYVRANASFLQKFQGLLRILAFDWVTNDLKIVLQGLNEGVQLMIQRLVEQILLLGQLEEFIRLAATTTATKRATPSVLSRILPFRYQIVLSCHIFARIKCRNSNHFVNGKLQLVSTIFCWKNSLASE